MKVKIERMYSHSRMPKYGTPGSAAFDIRAINAQILRRASTYTDIAFQTGLKFEIPEGHVLLLYSRSGHAYKQGINLVNCVGVIDSDYRGELQVMLRVPDMLDEDTILNLLDNAICQGMIMPVQQVEFETVEAVSETLRGAGGFGSTNVNP